MMTHTCPRTLHAPTAAENLLLGLTVKTFFNLTLTYQNGAVIESWVPGQPLHCLDCGALEQGT